MSFDAVQEFEDKMNSPLYSAEVIIHNQGRQCIFYLAKYHINHVIGWLSGTLTGIWKFNLK